MEQSECVNGSTEGISLIKKEIHESCDSKNGKNWNQDDLNFLLDKMKTFAPEKDKALYSTRVEKLPWDSIAFKSYSADDCKNVWLAIQRQLRHFRILNELVTDAKELLAKSNFCLYESSHIRYHLEKPRRPLTTYMLFFKKHKDDVLRENPGMNMSQVCKKVAELYRNLTPKNKEVYIEEAAVAKKQYEEKLKDFHHAHPDFKGCFEVKKLKTPFESYYEEQLKKCELKNGNRKVIREKCKLDWKNLSDERKLIWINYAEEQQCKFEEQVRTFSDQSSNGVAVPSKTILTREERFIKEKAAGKPLKPPNSAYHLFLRTMLQSNEMKDISPKERMIHIATLWKDVPEEKKDEYREQSKQLMMQYKTDFNAYLNKLPLKQQQEELQVSCRKRKGSMPASNSNDLSDTDAENILKKPKLETSMCEEDTALSVKKSLELQQPKKPPSSPFTYFCLKYDGDVSSKTAWSKLTSQEKQMYKDELDGLKKAYIDEYEKFLRSLSKEELEIFSIQNI